MKKKHFVSHGPMGFSLKSPRVFRSNPPSSHRFPWVFPIKSSMSHGIFPIFPALKAPCAIRLQGTSGDGNGAGGHPHEGRH